MKQFESFGPFRVACVIPDPSKAGHTTVDFVNVIVEVDVLALADKLGPRARKSVKHRAVEAGGRVVVRYAQYQEASI